MRMTVKQRFERTAALYAMTKPKKITALCLVVLEPIAPARDSHQYLAMLEAYVASTLGLDQ